MKRTIRSARGGAGRPVVQWNWMEWRGGAPGRGARGRAGLGVAVTVGLLIAALPAPAHAVCSNHNPDEGETVTCDTNEPNPDPESIVGGGSSSVTVNVLLDAIIETGEDSINGANADDWLVNNSGSISGSFDGIDGRSGSGWTINNVADSVVSGDSNGIRGESGSGWTINNSGSISGGFDGIIAGDGSDWRIDNSGSISGGLDGIFAGNGSSWTIDNSGSISGEGDDGISGNGGSDWSIDNSGSISGGDSPGNRAIFMTDGSISNHAGAEISGFEGVFLGGVVVNATIDNAGTITGTGGNAIFAESDTESVELVLRGTSVLQGDVELQGGSNTLSHTLSLEGGNSEDSNFAGLSQVNVQAGADWTLSGNLTPLTSGTLDADVAGTLRLNGLLEGAVQVQADGRLGGTGTVGETTNEGTVAPGDSIGMLTVDGVYTHATSATFEVEIDPSDSDLLDISGAADLQGGTVSVLLAPGDYEPGTEIPILTADGGLTGEFDTLESDNPDVALDLVHEPENNRVLLVVSQQQEEGADLALGKTATVNEGATVVFTLEVTNNGPEDATEVVVVDTLPACVAFTEDDCGGTEADGEWTREIDQLAAGETASCQLTVDASGCAGEGEQTNTAEVSSEALDDPNPDNDTAEAVFDLEVVPALPRLAFVLLLALLSLAALGTLRRSNA